jgi:hypothetical protein
MKKKITDLLDALEMFIASIVDLRLSQKINDRFGSDIEYRDMMRCEGREKLEKELNKMIDEDLKKEKEKRKDRER